MGRRLIIIALIISLTSGCRPIQRTTPVIDNNPDKNIPKEITVPVEIVNNDSNNKTPLVEYVGFINGVSDGQLGYPISIDTDGAGNIYVLDLYSTDGAVKKFSRFGDFISKFYTMDGPIYSRPTDIIVTENGEVYISDIMASKVTHLSSKGDIIKTFEIANEEIYFSPMSIALDSNYNLYALSQEKIFVFNKEGKNISVLDGSKEGWAQIGYFESSYYMGPTSLKIDSHDYLYLTDTFNNRIIKLNKLGKVVFTIENENVEERFLEISDVAISKGGDIYVSDIQTNKIYVFDKDGEYLFMFGGKGSRQGLFGNMVSGLIPTGPTGMVITRDNTILIIDSYNHRIQGFDLNGQFLFSFGDKELDRMFLYPRRMTGDGKGNIFLTSGYSFMENRINFRLQNFSAEGPLRVILQSGYQSGSFNDPQGVAVDRWGNIYLLDLDIIQRFNSRGRFEYGFGGEGTAPGKIGIFEHYGIKIGPVGIATDREGFVYIADTFNNRIQKFSPGGDVLSQIFIDKPTDIKIVNGKIYVLSSINSNVKILDLEGKEISEINGFFDNPPFDFFSDTLGLPSMEVMEGGLILIADYYNHGILIINEQGDRVVSFGELGSLPGQFAFPSSLYYDSFNKLLFVADSNNHRIQIFRINLNG